MKEVNRKNQYTYEKRRHRGFRLQVLVDFVDEELMDYCCALNQEDPQIIDNSAKINSSHCARVFRFRFQGQSYYHKSYLARNKMEPIKSLFCATRAERALKGHLILQRHGYPAPLVIMAGYKGKHNFMVTRAVENALDLYNFLHKHYASDGKDRVKILKRKDLVDTLGHLIGKLHRQRICHGDLRWGNLLLSIDEKDRLCCYFIDNERTQQHILLSNHARLKNLVQLNMVVGNYITYTDRLRFFNAYLSENPALKPQKHYWITKIMNRTKQRIDKKQKKNAKVQPSQKDIA